MVTYCTYVFFSQEFNQGRCGASWEEAYGDTHLRAGVIRIGNDC